MLSYNPQPSLHSPTILYYLLPAMQMAPISLPVDSLVTDEEVYQDASVADDEVS